jgi:hypothetical protein
MTLTIDQLFTPQQSGVTADVTDTPADGTWYASLIATAAVLGLPTTSWQPGAPERTILATASVALAQADVLESLMAQGGFLDFAASGTVTTVALNGTSVTLPVTPDPSIAAQNPTGAPGWLDALGQSFFAVTRLAATAASGPLAIVNMTGGLLTYVAGTYHVANTITGALYSNASALNVPPGGPLGGGITAVTTGTPTTTVTTSTAHSRAVGDVVYFTGVVGVSGINGMFATVQSVPSATVMVVTLTTTGTWTSAGDVWKTTLATFTADVVGIASNAAAGQVTTAVTAAPNVGVGNLASWSAANWESNTAYANRCRLSLGARSPNGPGAAYEYFALTAQQILLAQTPPVLMTNGPIVKATTFVNASTGVVTTMVASSTPASVTLGANVTPGCSNLAITGATNASPIVISTASAHGLLDGDAVIISGVLGNGAANGGYLVTVTGGSSFSLNGSTGTGTYTGGGIVEGGDLGQVDALIQANVVPDGATIAVTQSAAAFPVTIVATVVVPASLVTTYIAAASPALQALLASLDIGGEVIPPSSTGILAISAVEGALVEAGVQTLGAVSYVKQVSNLRLNGSGTDLSFPAPSYEAILSAPILTVVGI